MNVPALLFLSTTLCASLIGCHLSDENSVAGRPVAAFTAQPPLAGCCVSICFDAADSYHEDPSLSISSYEWDFDYDGSAFQVEQTGREVFHAYDSSGVRGLHTVALRVTGSGRNHASDLTTAEVEIAFQNFPPVADAGSGNGTGYFVAPGETLCLDASDSRDPNAPCDAVTAFAWDTDGDGLFGAQDTDGTPWSVGTDLTGPTPSFTDSWHPGMQFPVEVRVKDCYGEWSNAARATVTVTSG